jgi:hypothetical protein
VEIERQPPADLELLPVLLPEHRDRRTDQGEELGDDRGHAPEVTRAPGPAQPLGEAGDLDEGLVTRRIHPRRGGGEHRVHPDTGALRQVTLQVARVAAQILGGPELAGVDEDAHHRAVGAGAGGLHQAEVASMEEPHRRHQTDPAPLAAGGLCPGGDRPGLAEDSQRH